jgi:hypothetical protein
MDSIRQTILIRSAISVTCILLAFPAQADFKRDYNSGVRDYYSGEYAAAIKNLESAIEAESSAQEKVRFYGMRYEPYIPYFFLGQSKFKLNDCDGALVEWGKSLAQGVATVHEDFAELQANQAECEKKLDKPPAALIKAVEDYFEGNFRAAAGIDPDMLEEDRAKLQALLFRAASNFNIYLLSGQKDSQAEQRALNDIDRIRELDQNFSPYAEVFSPQFLLLFNIDPAG